MSGALWFAVLATATITGVLALLYRAETQRWRKWLQVLATLPSGGADSGP